MTGSSDARMGYVAIADHLEQRIRDGEFDTPDPVTGRAAGQLPGRREIADQYGVSTKTASAAGDLLTRRGIVYTRSGVGTFVRPATPVQRIVRTPGRNHAAGSPWLADAERAGLIGGWDSHSLFCVPAPDPIAVRLGIAPGDPCTRTDYVFTAKAGDGDAEPIMLSTSWEPHAITGTTPVVAPEAGPYAGRGVRERMEAAGVEVTRATESIGARPATDAEARALGVAPAACLITITRTYYGIVRPERREFLGGPVPGDDGQERPVETADLRYPADRYEVQYEVPMYPRSQ